MRYRLRRLFGALSAGASAGIGYVARGFPIRFGLRTLLILAAVGAPLIAYAGSYYVLSRRGYAYADSVHAKGFWFVPPETKRDVKRNNDLIRLYYPLVRFEQICGSKRSLACEPCFFTGDGLPP